jgi:hypothetical protein
MATPSALFPVREIRACDVRAVPQAHLLEHRLRRRAQHRLLVRWTPEAEARARVRLHREHHVLERGEF